MPDKLLQGKSHQKNKSEKQKAGVPSIISEEIQIKICELLKVGNYIETACACVGISKNTVYEWLKRGARSKDKNDRYKIFSDAVEKAQGEAEARDVLLIAKASEKQWQASAWRLERKFPDKWGHKTKTELSGSVDSNITFENLSEEEINKMFEDYVSKYIKK